MGYDIIGYHRKTDEEAILHEVCMYAYEPIFKSCFGKDITEFSGIVTKQKIDEFDIGLNNFKSDIKNNLDHEQIRGYVSNITYDKLCNSLSELLELMKNKQVGYLRIF